MDVETLILFITKHTWRDEELRFMLLNLADMYEEAGREEEVISAVRLLAEDKVRPTALIWGKKIPKKYQWLSEEEHINYPSFLGKTNLGAVDIFDTFDEAALAYYRCKTSCVSVERG